MPNDVVNKCERCGTIAGENELAKCPICLKTLCKVCWGLGNQYPDTNCAICEQEKWE